MDARVTGGDRARPAVDDDGVAVHAVLRQVAGGPVVAGDPQLHLVVPVGADGAGVVWLSQHFSRAGGLPAPPPSISRSIAFSLPTSPPWSDALVACAGAGPRLRVVGAGPALGISLSDWEMMTYWAIVGLSPRSSTTANRAPASCRAQLETRLVAPQLNTPAATAHRTSSSTRCTPFPR